MVCSLDKVERIVIGTMLNDFGDDGFFRSCSMSLRSELFSDRKNAFIFDMIRRMNADGIYSTTPLDVFVYAQQKGIKFGNVHKFVSYMTELACMYYAINGFKNYVKTLVKLYSKRRIANA